MTPAPEDDLPFDERAADGASPDETHVYVTAFTEFYYARFAKLVAFLVCQGARLVVATDIAQETMRKVWENWPKIRSPKAWAEKAALNELIRQQRSESREVLSGSVPEHTTLKLDDKGCAEFEANQVAIWALQRLSPVQRRVICLTLLQYLPSEIAAILDMTPEAVRSSLKLARRKVARWLYGGEESSNDDE